MRHLHLVPATAQEPPGNPEDDATRRTAGAVDDGDIPAFSTSDREVDLPAPAPELADMFARTDQLLEGLSPEEKLAAARTLYYDADGQPQARSLNLRPL